MITAHQLLAQLEEFFPNAKEYIPERWIKGHPLESQHSPYALLPFGFGKRMCVGRRLAELEMEQLTIKVSLLLKKPLELKILNCFFINLITRFYKILKSNITTKILAVSRAQSTFLISL